ncbi:alpha/beta hydrolase [Burkholderia diffusa]|uniref:alpha/beta hydrolase n=1 Tax=Burkholderia diffusa TaxID=488732 RepID=UPI002AB02256|nr:alpha/beta hydrolase [Burkholderia diffusa]
MDTRHLVDPDIRPWLDVWPTVTLTADNLARHRDRVLPLPPIDTVGNTLQHRRVPGSGGAPDVPVRVYLPDDATRPLPAIVHMHGGGYVRGAAKDLEAVHRPLVKTLGCALVSIDYRLAPETPFPGAIDDCYAALAWTFHHADALGIDPSRIGVMGESAGGGLAAALALLARDRGEYPLAFQHLMYPMLDDRTCVRAPHPHAGEFVWHAANNRFAWTSLLGHAPGLDGVSPYAAAARAERLDGLPLACTASTSCPTRAYRRPRGASATTRCAASCTADRHRRRNEKGRPKPPLPFVDTTPDTLRTHPPAPAPSLPSARARCGS